MEIDYVHDGRYFKLIGIECMSRDEHTPLVVATSQPSDNFQEVQPTRALFLSSQPCEKKAAAITNKSRKAMEEKNISDVVYRYVQNKQGANGSLLEMTGYAYSLLVCFSAIAIFNMISFMYNSFSNDAEKEQIVIGSIAGLSLFTLIPSFFSLGVILADTQNMRRYSQTEKQCLEWLREKLSAQQIKHVEKIRLDAPGMFALKQFISDAKLQIPTETVQKKLEKFGCAWSTQ